MAGTKVGTKIGAIPEVKTGTKAGAPVGTRTGVKAEAETATKTGMSHAAPARAHQTEGQTEPHQSDVPSAVRARNNVRYQAATPNTRGQAPNPDKPGANVPGPESLAEVLTVFEFYRDEAAKCAEAEACLGGCVFLASALEASLLAMTRCFPEEVEKFIASSNSKEFSRPPKDWGLSQLLLVARGLGWLPNSENKDAGLDPNKAQVGDLVDVVRVVRNLIHPSIYLRDYPGEQLDWKALEVSFRILDASCSCLAAKLEDAMKLTKHL